jgi:hypothetical protein
MTPRPYPDQTPRSVSPLCAWRVVHWDPRALSRELLSCAVRAWHNAAALQGSAPAAVIVQSYGGSDGVNQRRLGVSWLHVYRTVFQQQPPAGATSASNIIKRLFLRHLQLLEALPLPQPPLATAEVPRPVRAARAAAADATLEHQQEAASSSDEEDADWAPEDDGQAAMEDDSDAVAMDEAEVMELSVEDAIFALNDALRDGDDDAVRRLLDSTPGLLNYKWHEVRAGSCLCTSRVRCCSTHRPRKSMAGALNDSPRAGGRCHAADAGCHASATFCVSNHYE